MSERITARTNEKIKYAVKLSGSSSFRREKGEFILEGARLCSDAADTGICLEKAFYTAKAMDRYIEYMNKILECCTESYEISEDVSAKLSDTENSQGVFCICKLPKNENAELSSAGKYLALENIQDPSNIGAISRTAEAMGLDGLIVSGGCDIYNPKALRAAMGSSLRLSIIQTDSLPDFIQEAKKSGIKSYASTPAKDALDIRIADMTGGVICCVGNEGNGLKSETIAACDSAVTIPMEGRAESFNASVAAAIIAWELKR